ncbi:MAG: hypothetical protein PHG48_08340, partial [Eubacteriales bacterium]|nr:hypothetical protein [Eubacteriales bacterium]
MGETRQEARQGMRQGTVLCPADNGAAAKETAGAKVKSGAGALPEAGTEAIRQGTVLCPKGRQGMRQGTVLCPADNGAATKETAGTKVKSGAGALTEAGTGAIRQGIRQGTVLCPADNGAATKETAGAKVKSGAGALTEAGAEGSARPKSRAGALPASRAAAVAGSATSAKSSARSRARAAARKFLDEEKEYQMGDIAAEQPNRLTAGLSDTFATNTKDGVRMLLAVDKEAAAILKKSLLSREYKEFAAAVTDTFKKGGRVILSGCGSSGRLCMRLEASWRKALKDMSAVNPGRETLLNDLADKVITLMTGGDYAVIRAVESFEDYASLSRAQMEELCPDENDLVIGVTATAETTSIIGSAMAAAQKGAKVYMLVCTPPESVSNKMKRAEELYSHPNVSSFYIPIKGMALTGSTRMQSSTVEQAAAACALQEAMAALLEEEGISISKLTPEQFADTFSDLVRSLAQKDSVENMARYLEYETGIYSRE